jgi:hypothetical protein
MSLARVWKRLLLIGLVACTAVLTGAVYTLLRTPSWYCLPVIPPERRQTVRNNLLAAEQAFTEGLRTSAGPFIYHVFQDDVNRWIAMRREIYPLIDELAPPELVDPMVVFDTGGITVAGRYKKGVADVVVSLDISVRWRPDATVLTLEAIRCGSMRVPLDFVALGLNRPIDRPAEESWPGSPRIWGSLATGLFIAPQAWWKNGGIDYRVNNVTIEPGKLNLTIEPLGRHAGKARKNQS